jgi:hypothetical protein
VARQPRPLGARNILRQIIYKERVVRGGAEQHQASVVNIDTALGGFETGKRC